MSDVDAEALVRAIQDRVGADLRVVARYDEGGYELLYEREGLGPRVDELADSVHRDLVLQGIGREHVEALFAAGRLRSTILHFDEITVVYLSTGAYSGIFVSLDAGVDVSVSTFTDVFEAHR